MAAMHALQFPQYHRRRISEDILSQSALSNVFDSDSKATDTPRSLEKKTRKQEKSHETGKKSRKVSGASRGGYVVASRSTKHQHVVKKMEELHRLLSHRPMIGLGEDGLYAIVKKAAKRRREAEELVRG